MKISTLILPVLMLGFAGAANAGKTAAGPAAGAASVGSVIVPGSNSVLGTPRSDDGGKRLTGGRGGRIVLTGDQLANAASRLGSAEGAVVNGPIIKAPTTLNDGGTASIVLNTETGELLIVRND